MSASNYEWVRNWSGLMSLRENCSKGCWMSDAAWTEWKSYSRPRYNYVAWLPGGTPYSIFRSATLGTRSLFNRGSMQYEMSLQARKNVQRLRISKSLTTDDLSVRLAASSSPVTRPWSSSGSGSADWRDSDTISWQYCGRGNGKQALIDEYVPSGKTLWDSENADILADVIAFKGRARHNFETGKWY